MKYFERIRKRKIVVLWEKDQGNKESDLSKLRIFTHISNSGPDDFRGRRLLVTDHLLFS